MSNFRPVWYFTQYGIRAISYSKMPSNYNGFIIFSSLDSYMYILKFLLFSLLFKKMMGFMETLPTSHTPPSSSHQGVDSTQRQFGSLTQCITFLTLERAGARRREVTIKDFMHMQPPTFIGDQEKDISEVVENQISTIDRCFMKQFYIDEQMVAFTTYKLDKSTIVWWENFLEAQNEEETPYECFQGNVYI